MSDLYTQLSTRLRIEEVKKLADSSALLHGDLLEELVQIARDGEGLPSAQAIWVLTHAEHSVWMELIPHIDSFVAPLLTTKRNDKRRLLLTLLHRLLDIKFPRHKSRQNAIAIEDYEDLFTDGEMELLDFCFSHMMPTHNSVSSQSLCIKCAEVLTRQIPDLRNELRDTLTYLQEQPLTPAMAATIRNTLKLTR